MNAAIAALEQALATARHNELVFRAEDITDRAEAAAAEAAEITMALTTLRTQPCADPCCGDRGCCD